MYSWEQVQNLMAVFRRAGILMVVLGVLALLMGGCFGAAAGLVRWERMQPDVVEMVREFESTTAISFRAAMAVLSVMMVVPAVLMIVLGFFVRKGSRGAVIAGVVLAGLGLLFSLWNMVGSMTMGGPQAMGGICMSLLMLAVLGLLMVWLVQALRAVGPLREAQTAYQGQYWQYMQSQQQMQAQAYGQGQVMQQMTPGGTTGGSHGRPEP